MRDRNRQISRSLTSAVIQKQSHQKLMELKLLDPPLQGPLPRSSTYLGICNFLPAFLKKDSKLQKFQGPPKAGSVPDLKVPQAFRLKTKSELMISLLPSSSALIPATLKPAHSLCTCIWLMASSLPKSEDQASLFPALSPTSKMQESNKSLLTDPLPASPQRVCLGPQSFYPWTSSSSLFLSYSDPTLV